MSRNDWEILDLFGLKMSNPLPYRFFYSPDTLAWSLVIFAGSFHRQENNGNSWNNDHSINKWLLFQFSSFRHREKQLLVIIIIWQNISFCFFFLSPLHTELSCCEKFRRVLVGGIGKALGLVALLYIFICSLDLLSSAFKLVGGKTAGSFCLIILSFVMMVHSPPKVTHL